MGHIKDKITENYTFLIFLAALSIHVYLSTVGWDNYLLDRHGFRQTQTALTAYYFLQEGFRLDYITPVFGPPWTIPFEFPLYQTVVALTSMLSGIHLDQSGRIVSLLFFYLALAALYLLLGEVGLRRRWRFLFLSLVLASPTYIFWSRTFMIESMALFLCLLFAALALRAMRTGSLRAVLLSGLAGTLAGLVKTTTFAVFLIPVFLFCLWISVRKERDKDLGFYLLAGAVIFLLPVVAVWLWVGYADSLKLANPLTENLTSSNLKNWNYGTWSFKLSSEAWERIFSWASRFVISSPFLLVLLPVGFVFGRRLGIYAFGSVFIGLLGPLIFTNLYYIHDYYYYAVGVFFLAGIGFSLVSIAEKSKFKSLNAIILLLVLLVLYREYFDIYYPHQKTDYSTSANVLLFKVIKDSTEKDDVIIVFGHDWNPYIAYYSERKAIMGTVSISDKKFEQAIALFRGKIRIAAMIVPLKSETASLKRYIAEFGLRPTPTRNNHWGDLYLRPRW